MSLINFEINFILTWSSAYIITNSTGDRTFTLIDTKLYVLFTLSILDNAKWLHQLKSGF